MMVASSDRSPSGIAVGYGDVLECHLGAGSGTGGRAH